MSDTDGAVIEIVERHKAQEPGPGIIKPDELRINGQRVWVPKGEPITIHELTFNDGGAADDDVIKVTMTLWARRVYLGHASETSETPQRRVEDAQRRLAAAQAELTAAHEAAREVVAEQAPA